MEVNEYERDDESFLQMRQFSSSDIKWQFGPYSYGDLIRYIQFPHQHNRVYCGGRRHSILVFDTETGNLEQKVKLGTDIDLMCLSADEKHLATLSNEHRGLASLREPDDLKIWSTQTGQLLSSHPIDPGLKKDMTFSADGTHLFIDWARQVDGVPYKQIIAFEISE